MLPGHHAGTGVVVVPARQQCSAAAGARRRPAHATPTDPDALRERRRLIQYPARGGAARRLVGAACVL